MVLLCGNGLVFPIVYYGALRAGAVAVPLSPTLPVAELIRCVRRLRARLVACDEQCADAAAAAASDTGALRLLVTEDGGGDLSVAGLVDHPGREPRPLPAEQPAVILPTSGTTGSPKHAVHSHASLLRNAAAVAFEMLGLQPGDVQLGALPLAHSFGLSAVLNASLVGGASVVLMRRFDAVAARALMDQERVTVLQAVPTMLSRLTATQGSPPSRLRLCVVSGAPLPPGLATLVHERLCANLVERYGMTEVSPLTMRRVPRHGGPPGDVGQPLSGVVVRTVDGAGEGELEAAAPTMFSGYDGDAEATSAALRGRFLRTGDLGSVAGDGRVTLTGRLKDVIVRGGHKVPARQIERVIEAHPDVVEAAVVGVPDPDLGEEVVAVLVSPRGDGVIDELRQLCAAQLARYMQPRRWYVLSSLPRTSSGKVRKQELRASLR